MEPLSITQNPEIAQVYREYQGRSKRTISLALTRENTCGNTGDQINQSVNMIESKKAAHIGNKQYEAAC